MPAECRVQTLLLFFVYQRDVKRSSVGMAPRAGGGGIVIVAYSTSAGGEVGNILLSVNRGIM